MSDPDSFANKLHDKRYAEFVSTYNFEKYGEKATVFNRAQHDAPTNFASSVVIGTLDSGFGFVEDEVGYYVSSISNVESIDDLMADSRLLYVAMGAFGLELEDGDAGADQGNARRRCRRSAKSGQQSS